MGKTYGELTQKLKDFISQQKMFFVATASADGGEVNVSPKGYDTLRIIDDETLLYLDYYGSGNNTAKHLRGDARITLMWCSFDEKPCILRVYGTGEAVLKNNPSFAGLAKRHFEGFDAAIIRQLFIVRVRGAMTSCGWSVPIMRYEKDRTFLHEHMKRMMVKNPAGKLISKMAENRNIKEAAD
jgi:hypothetical protein